MSPLIYWIFSSRYVPIHLIVEFTYFDITIMTIIFMILVPFATYFNIAIIFMIIFP